MISLWTVSLGGNSYIFTTSCPHCSRAQSVICWCVIVTLENGVREWILAGYRAVSVDWDTACWCKLDNGFLNSSIFCHIQACNRYINITYVRMVNTKSCFDGNGYWATTAEDHQYALIWRPSLWFKTCDFTANYPFSVFRTPSCRNTTATKTPSECVNIFLIFSEVAFHFLLPAPCRHIFLKH